MHLNAFELDWSIVFNPLLRNRGHHVEAKELLQATIQLLEASRLVELDPASVAQELASLIEEDKVQNIDTRIFNNSLFFAEEGIRNHIGRLLEKESKNLSTQKKLNKRSMTLKKISTSATIPSKRKAIQEAIQQKVFCA